MPFLIATYDTNHERVLAIPSWPSSFGSLRLLTFSPTSTSAMSLFLFAGLLIFGVKLEVSSSFLVLRVVFPLTEPRKPPGRESPKNGEKITKFPSPAQPPKMGKNYRKITKKMYFRSIVCNFSVIFPHFRGLDRGGEFCNFSPFSGIPAPGASGAL